MASPPPTLPKSRGHSLFDRMAQKHAQDPDKPSSQNTSSTPKPLPPLRTSYSVSSPPVPRHPYSPISTHHRSPSSTSESYTYSNNNSVQLLSVHPRLESNYIKEIPPPAPLPPTVSAKLQETDFPLYESSEKEEAQTPTTVIEKAFDYLEKHDDYNDDDDVIHQESFNEQECNSDSFDDENEDNIDITPSIQNNPIDSKFSFILCPKK